ncbi:ankyrin repeat domain-containing protein 6-like isoform X2 [Corticium candelabrum]|uniref:ankyrin repeat domain-containing protein 6-like isoform X2 n=2 Tax=Corticium candelabrum TaxID=121492 RepID=UPI002E256B66|nr:ankyrin repeat domain-containing protein 6-like isoform X2 [Corticium candelabrum]
MAAASHGDDFLIVMLLSANADINQQCNRSWKTALHCAASCNHSKVVRILLENGCDSNIRSQCGLTPLHCATLENHCEVVRILLENGCNVNIPNNGGETALHCAAYDNQSKVVCILLENGCDANIKNNDGETALEIAEKENKNDAADAMKSFTMSSKPSSPSPPLSHSGAISSTATAGNVHFCPPVTQRMRTSTPTLEPPRQLAGKGDEQVVEQQIQQIEQLRMEGSSNDREIAEATQQTVAIRVDRKTQQPTAKAEAEKKCTDDEIVRVARLVSCWEELVSLLSPKLFSVGVIDNIKKADQQPFMQARKALAKWADYMVDKASRRMMIKTMCVDMSLRAQAI